jgi:hypothetical protein
MIWDWIQKHILGRSDIYSGGVLYMRRWRVGPKWFLGLRLHHIVRSDADPELHDHPFSFATLILRGGYTEQLADGTRTRHGPGSVLFRSAEVLHRLDLDKPAWTVVLRGPIRRSWGFMTRIGWMPWQRFVDAKRVFVPTAPIDTQWRAESSL